MSRPSTLAIIFDFDDTLVPDSTTQFLKSRGIDTKRFWSKDHRKLVLSGYDSTLAFLKLFLANVGDDKPLGLLTNADLRAFGASLDVTFYTGLPQLFTDLRAIVSRAPNLGIEFYVVSGGLQAIIEGSAIVQQHFNGVYGCLLDEDGTPPAVRHIQRAINFTEKTRYLFEINKGITPGESVKNPFLVNRDVPKHDRRIPFANMIYIGDGLTDIPCFSLVEARKGLPVGVWEPSDRAKAERALQELVTPSRVRGPYRAKYGADDDLGALLRALVEKWCGDRLIGAQLQLPEEE